MTVMKAADRLPEKTLEPVMLPDLQLFSQGSGDPNLIHLDDAVAKSMGLPGPIAHGMLISGFLAERALELRDRERPDWKLAHWQIRFRAMTFLGDVLSLGSQVKSVSDSELELELSARNQRGEMVATATARLSR